LYAADRPVNQSGMVMISQSHGNDDEQHTNSMTAIDNGNTDDNDAMTVMKSADQESKSEVTAASMPVETTTDGGETLMS
jgi:hypothetical protein